MPVTYSSNEIFMQLINFSLGSEGKRTLLISGGGASGAMGNIGLAHRCLRMLEEQGVKNLYSNIVILSHIGGSPRIIRTQDPAAAENYIPNAEIAISALWDAPFYVNRQDLSIFGFSAGGVQAMEMAALLGDRCKQVVLMESGGLSEEPHIVRNMFNNFVALVRKHFIQEKQIFKAFQNALWEKRVSWVDPKGVPSPKRMFQTMFDGNLAMMDLASRLGFKEDEIADTYINIGAIGTDSTLKSREQLKSEIIFSPVIYSGVLNVIARRLNLKIKQLKQLPRDTVEKLAYDLLRKLYPNASNIKFLPYEDITHSAPMFEIDYIRQIVRNL